MQIELSARENPEPFRAVPDHVRHCIVPHENGEHSPKIEEMRTNGTKRHRTPPRNRQRIISESEKVEIAPQVVIESSSDEDEKPIAAIIKNRSKRVKIESQIMDEALYNLISQDR